VDRSTEDTTKQMIDLVAVFTNNGHPVDSTNSLGSTALHRAVSRGNIPMVKKLLQEGANPVKKNDSGMTPVMIAAYCGNDEVLKLCINDEKANKNYSVKKVMNDPSFALSARSSTKSSDSQASGLRASDFAQKQSTKQLLEPLQSMLQSGDSPQVMQILLAGDVKKSFRQTDLSMHSTSGVGLVLDANTNRSFNKAKSGNEFLASKSMYQKKSLPALTAVVESQ
jgi:ankyrin repeat protein